MSDGILFDIKEFTVHDGPGIRATVFLKGCPLRCLWCHNPEGLLATPQLMITQQGCTGCGACWRPCAHEACQGLGRCAKACPNGLIKLVGERVSADALALRLKKLQPLLTDGGITLSGGEPLMQPTFVLELLDLLRPMHTIVETSGYASPEVFQAIAAACSTVYLDVKHSDPDAHKRLTGVSNDVVLVNLDWLKAQSKPFLVRIPLIPGLNDDAQNLRQTAAMLTGAKSLIRVELLRYNPFAGAKYKPVGMQFPLPDLDAKSNSAVPMRAFEQWGIEVSVL